MRSSSFLSSISKHHKTKRTVSFSLQGGQTHFAKHHCKAAPGFSALAECTKMPVLGNEGPCSGTSSSSTAPHSPPNYQGIPQPACV